MAARVLIAGAAGQVGRALAARLAAPRAGGPAAGLEPVGAGSGEMDITDPASIRAMLADVRPAVVVNCAAYTAVDAAEADEAAAHAVNAEGAGALAAAAAEAGAALVQVSTDYVFSGARPPAGPEGYEPDDPVDPRTAYGRTKAAGERAVRAAHPHAVIARTAWVYTGGERPVGGGDFVTTMRRLLAGGGAVRVVDDQRGSPTYAGDLAAGLAELAGVLVHDPGRAAGRVLHAAGGGAATWCEVARAVFAELGADPARVQACRTEDMPRPAPRPAYSVLSGRAWREAGLAPLRPWRAALAEALAAR